MAETTDEQVEEEPKKKGKLGLLLVTLVTLLAAGGGGFFAASSGLIPLPAKEAESEQVPETESPSADVAFVPLEPLIITLGRDAKNSHLRFNAQLEVAARYEAEITRMEPRFLDVLNGYLQALEAQDIEDPEAFVRMRAQLLRRMQVVAGEGRVRDLLVTEFVLN
ncbi:flagellar basal body-associated FliL family protein [Tropicimonas sp. S265A]|uniref:flagellar basal body-associated FliL family protein n=1 Tax=Tropicimonas sp. S265A TaxID=3415134 RepID=UPI003C7E030A